MLDGNGTLKLSDFGLSQLEGETLEEIFQETVDATYKPNNVVISPKSNKTLFGDPCYLAPEIINGEEHTKASDLWSLGCILYEMYTGRYHLQYYLVILMQLLLLKAMHHLWVII